MKVQQKASGDTRLGKDAIECVVKMSQQVREYLSYAIEYANNQNHETPEQFWTYLFWNVTKNPGYGNLICGKGANKIPVCPKNPYRELNFLTVCRFLCFGSQRLLPNGIREDSQYFYQTYGINRPQFEKNLRWAIKIYHNCAHHPGIQGEEVFFSRKELEQAKELYQSLTTPLEPFETKWKPEGLERISTYWKQMEQVISHQFGPWPAVSHKPQQSEDGQHLAAASETASRRKTDLSSNEISQERSKTKIMDNMKKMPSSKPVTKGHQQAAEEGNAGKSYLAQANRHLERGEGEQAVPLLRQAIDCGEADALELLAQCYASGTGVAWDLQEAERLLIKWAMQGDGETKLSLALRYKKGIDVSKSLYNAQRWLERAQQAGAPNALNRLAAEQGIEKLHTGLLAQAVKTFTQTRARAQQGDPEAQNRIGILLTSGHGAKQDYMLAAAWFRMAAEKGLADAQFHLGDCYLIGQGTNVDHGRAAAWFRKAAEQGHIEAQLHLGDCYDRNYNGTRDPIQAKLWYQKAAEGGNTSAMRSLAARCAHEGNDAQAASWYRKAAELGDPHAQYRLADCYDEGRGVEQDPVQAAFWLQKAARRDHIPAQLYLGLFYQEGRGVEQSDEQAVFWFRTAAEQDEELRLGWDWGLYSNDAQCCLGDCYAQGRGVPQDDAQAAFWYQKAADEDYHRGENSLGLCYRDGRGVPQDYERAFSLFQTAANGKNTCAQYNLGVCYQYGYGTPPNRRLAVKWYKWAAAHGSQEAKKRLAELRHSPEREPTPI